MSTTADPTMDLIRSLDNPAKWLMQTVVAFVPHEITHPAKRLADGTTLPPERIKVTEDQLRQDADRANARAAATGRLDTLTIGHRKFDPGFPETQQPPLVGFCRNYRVQWIEREKGRFLALVYDEYAAKDKAQQYDLYRQFPFRSAEYHPTVGMQGVAALVRPPALDMGTTYVYQSVPGAGVMDMQQTVAIARQRQQEMYPKTDYSGRDRVLAYMREVPGRTYEESVTAVLGFQPAITQPQSYEQQMRALSPQAMGDPLAQLREPGSRREEIVEYMRLHPGMTYALAEAHILDRHGR